MEGAGAIEGPIRIGLAVREARHGAPRADDEGRARLDRFCAALGGALGAEVSPYGIAHYRELLEAMHEGRLDLAWLPPIVALRAASRGRTLPIAIPIRGGVASFASALFAAPGSALRGPADLVGARAAWVDPQSAAGFLVIRATLRAQGYDLARAFAEQSFLGSHEAVVEAVLSGQADVGATFVHLDAARDNAVLRAGWGDAAPQVLAYGGPIPADVVAAGIHVPASSIRAVQRALCAASHTELAAAALDLLDAQGFIVPQPEHLDPLGRLLGYLDDLRHSSRPPPR